MYRREKCLLLSNVKTEEENARENEIIFSDA